MTPAAAAGYDPVVAAKRKGKARAKEPKPLPPEAPAPESMPLPPPLDAWAWVLRKRLELWAGVRIAELIAEGKGRLELIAWLDGVRDLQGSEAFPIGAFDQKNWEAFGRTLFSGLEPARSKLQAFDKQLSKRVYQQDPARLRAEYRGGIDDLPARERRDEWLASATPAAHDCLRGYQALRARQFVLPADVSELTLVSGIEELMRQGAAERDALEFLGGRLRLELTLASWILGPGMDRTEARERVDQGLKHPDVLAKLRGGEAHGEAGSGPREAAYVLVALVAPADFADVSARTVKHAAQSRQKTV